MLNHAFEAIGTAWNISVDSDEVTLVVFEELQKLTTEFDQQYSRFISSSEVCQLYEKGAGTSKVSPKLAVILAAGKNLEQLTQGNFNLAIGQMIEKSGYDKNYSFKNAPLSLKPQQLQWELHKTQVSLSQPTLFDIGSIGKGFLIDEVAQVLRKNGYQHFLVEAGGDMFATQKQSGAPWNIAIEWPGKPDLALGTIKIQNQGFAASDIYKRSWKNWNHLIGAKTGKPITHIHGCIGVSDSAFKADQLTSALTFTDEKNYPYVQEKIGGEYIVLMADQSAHISPGWPGEFF